MVVLPNRNLLERNGMEKNREDTEIERILNRVGKGHNMVHGLPYWKGRVIDSFAAWKQNSTDEYLKAWLFAVAKVESLEWQAKIHNVSI
jgi:hypothetical protein